MRNIKMKSIKIKFTAVYIAALTGAIILNGCSHANKNVKASEGRWFGSAKADSKDFFKTKVYKYELENGLKLVVLEDHSAPTFAYQTWFKVGSVDEEPGLTGLAHLFEHMMFKATSTYEDQYFDKTLESAGAEGENAFTNRDYTGYVQSLPRHGKQDNLDLIAKLEADRMINLIVDDASLDKEREVVQNERRFRNENSPDGKLYEKVYTLAFTKHSYHWPVIGYEEDLKRAKSKECLAFYKRYYAPNNAVIAIVGDVDHEDALKVVQKYYGHLKRSEIKRRNIPKEPPQTAERIENVKLKLEVEKLYMGYRIQDGKHPDFATLEVIRSLLSGGKSSRLYHKLVDGGIASGVDIDNSEDREPGLFLFSVDMQKGKTAMSAIKAIDSELNRLKKADVSDEEIKGAIALLRFTIFNDLTSSESKAKFIGFYETILDDFEVGVRFLEDIKKVTKTDIARVAKTYFEKKNRSAVIGIPERGSK